MPASGGPVRPPGGRAAPTRPGQGPARSRPGRGPARAAAWARGGRERARRPTGWTLVVLGILAAVAAVRLAFLLSDAGRLTADETVSALASQDVLRGHLAVFYPGQRYMGTFESAVAAADLAVLPDDALTVRLPQLGLALVTAWALIATALRLGATRGQAALTGALFAAGPAFLVVNGVRTNGAYATVLLVGTLAIWMAVVGARAGRPVRWAGAFGLLCGFGAWENTQTAYLLVPAAVWLAAGWRGERARCAGAFAVGAVVGVAPVLVSIARGGLGGGLLGLNDPAAPADQAHATLSTRWDAFYGGELPQLLGLRQTPNGAPVAAWFPAGPLVLLAAAALGAALWTRRESVVATLRLAPRGRDPLTLPLLGLTLAPLLYAASARGVYAAEPRYLFGIYPALVLALGRLAPAGRRAGPLVAAGLVAATGALTLANLRALPPGSPSPAAARAAARVLEAAGEPDAWGYYFTVWPVEYFADGRVRVSALSPQRFPARARAVGAAAHPAYVVAPGAEDGQVQAAFAAHGVRAQRTDVGGLVVYTRLEPPLQPGQLGL